MIIWYVECNGKAFFTFLANIEAFERWQLNHHESAWIVPGTIEE